MSMGDLTSNAEALGDFLKTTRAGVKLPTAFAQMIQATLSDTFEVDTEDGLVNLGAQIVWSAVEQANKDIKPVLGDLFFRWLNTHPGRHLARLFGVCCVRGACLSVRGQPAVDSLRRGYGHPPPVC